MLTQLNIVVQTTTSSVQVLKKYAVDRDVPTPPERFVTDQASQTLL